MQAVYDFDMRLKSLLYPQIMFLETAIKNYALEIIVDRAQSERFVDVYSKLMLDYKTYPLRSRDYNVAITKRMNVRNKVYSNISRDYGRNNIIKHYYDKDNPLPVWAVFELLSLGEFGNLLSTLHPDVRKEIAASIGIDVNVDADGKMTEKIVLTLKDLRNAVAHNNTIFDTRFRSGSINKRISKYIESVTRIQNITFDSIVDYIILITFMMYLLQCAKKDMIAFIKQFENAYENLRKHVPTSVYSQVIYTDTRTKLQVLKNFL